MNSRLLSTVHAMWTVETIEEEEEEEEEEEREGEEADLRWNLGYDEEALPVAQRASVEGMVAGVGCWWRKKKSCRGERLGSTLTIWGVRAVTCDGDGGFQAGGNDVSGWTPRWRERETQLLLAQEPG